MEKVGVTAAGGATAAGEATDGKATISAAAVNGSLERGMFLVLIASQTRPRADLPIVA